MHFILCTMYYNITHHFLSYFLSPFCFFFFLIYLLTSCHSFEDTQGACKKINPGLSKMAFWPPNVLQYYSPRHMNNCLDLLFYFLLRSFVLVFLSFYLAFFLVDCCSLPCYELLFCMMYRRLSTMSSACVGGCIHL